MNSKTNLFFQSLKIWVYTYFKAPLIYQCKPRLIEMDETRCHILIPFKRKTRNPMGSFYLGAFSIGGDLACGYLANHFMGKYQNKVRFIFKDLQTNFIKMAKSDVHFICENGKEIETSIQEALTNDKLHLIQSSIQAYCKNGTELQKVAELHLTLAFRKKP